MAKITLKDLSHSYLEQQNNNSDWALRDVNIDWKDGGAYALLGPSGCGKTTLLNIVSGLLKPTKGSVLFDDKDMTSLNPVERDIAQIFQFPVIYDTMTVYENLAFPLKNRGLSDSEVASKVKEIAEMLELTTTLNNRASGLTADGKQKISLGRGLVRSDVNVINVLLSKSIKSCSSLDKLMYDVAIKKPSTTGRNFNGPSITSTTVLSIFVEVLLTNLFNLLIINLAKRRLKT